MSSATEWIKAHKTAVAVGVAGFVGLLLLTRKSSGGATSGGDDGLQVAQLQASQNVQQAQIQAQQNTQTISAQTQIDQTNAELQGQQDELITGLAQNLNATGTQASLQREQLQAEISQQQTYDSLLGPGINTALATAVKGGNKNSETGLNELALLLNEEGGAVSSFNAGTTTSPPLSQQILSFLSSAGSSSGPASLLAELGL